MYVYVHVCVLILLCIGALVFQVFHIDISEENACAKLQNNKIGPGQRQIYLSWT